MPGSRVIALAASTIALALAAAGPAVASAQSAVVHAPRIALKPATSGHGPGGSNTSNPFGWAASNWSGYAVTGTTYRAITGSWIVPTVSRSRGSTYSSSWVGIDGFNNSDLIQTGTEQDYASGKASYYAWWEILPAAETVIAGDPVRPGDAMSASIVNDGNGDWTITLSDRTAGWTFATTQAYAGPAASAEWIEEAPTIGGHVANLANYGLTTFDPGTVNGADPGLTASDGGVMIQGGSQVSTPSMPDSDTDGFNVQYGATIPAAPAS